MKTTVAILLGVMILMSSVSASAQKQNYSGTWKKDSVQSNPGSLSINSIPINMVIKQDDSKIKITRTSTNKMNDTTRYTEILKFDGTKAKSGIKENLNKSSYMEWSTQQNNLIETSDYSDAEDILIQTMKEEWLLTNNGNKLQIKCMLKAHGQSYVIVEVFDKQ